MHNQTPLACPSKHSHKDDGYRHHIGTTTTSSCHKTNLAAKTLQVSAAVMISVTHPLTS